VTGLSLAMFLQPWNKITLQNIGDEDTESGDSVPIERVILSNHRGFSLEELGSVKFFT